MGVHCTGGTSGQHEQLQEVAEAAGAHQSLCSTGRPYSDRFQDAGGIVACLLQPVAWQGSMTSGGIPFIASARCSLGRNEVPRSSCQERKDVVIAA
jgi:hypothetical protein